MKNITLLILTLIILGACSTVEDTPTIVTEDSIVPELHAGKFFESEENFVVMTHTIRNPAQVKQQANVSYDIGQYLACAKPTDRADRNVDVKYFIGLYNSTGQLLRELPSSTELINISAGGYVQYQVQVIGKGVADLRQGYLVTDTLYLLKKDAFTPNDCGKFFSDEEKASVQILIIPAEENTPNLYPGKEECKHHWEPDVGCIRDGIAWADLKRVIDGSCSHESDHLCPIGCSSQEDVNCCSDVNGRFQNGRCYLRPT